MRMVAAAVVLFLALIAVACRGEPLHEEKEARAVQLLDDLWFGVTVDGEVGALVDSFPDFPVPLEAEIVASLAQGAQTWGDATTYRALWRLEADVHAVRSSFQEALPRNGWTFGSPKVGEFKLGAPVLLAKDGRCLDGELVNPTGQLELRQVFKETLVFVELRPGGGFDWAGPPFPQPC